MSYIQLCSYLMIRMRAKTIDDQVTIHMPNKYFFGVSILNMYIYIFMIHLLHFLGN